MSNEFYSQREAAKLLQISPNYLLELLFSPKAFPLCPGVNLPDPVPMDTVLNPSERVVKGGLFDLLLYQVDAAECRKSGRLQLHQTAPLSIVNLSGELGGIMGSLEMHGIVPPSRVEYFHLHRKINPFVALFQDGTAHIIPRQHPQSIRLEELVIARRLLELYANKHGIDLNYESTQDPASMASQVLTAKRTAERDRYVDEIVAKIDALVREASKARTSERMINHIRFLKEAGVPDEKFEAVKKLVASRITKCYGEFGFKPLSRAPKKGVVEPYLLPYK